MTDRFNDLLQELGKIFDMSLHSDKLNACSILIPPNPVVVLQLDASQENFIIFSKIIELPPGKFRENTLCEALKANAEPDPKPGILGYIAANNHLAIYQSFPTSLLNGERLASLIGSLLETADLWKKAIEQGRSSPTSTPPPRPFGFKP